MSYPIKIETVVVETLGDDLCIYDTATKRVHSLNATAALVWQMCDAEHSVEQIADELASKFNTPDPDALVEMTRDELDRAQLLSDRGKSARPSFQWTRRHVIAGATAVIIPVVITMVAPLPAAAGSAIGTSTPTATATETQTSTP